MPGIIKVKFALKNLHKILFIESLYISNWLFSWKFPAFYHADFSVLKYMNKSFFEFSYHLSFKVPQRVFCLFFCFLNFIGV